MKFPKINFLKYLKFVLEKNYVREVAMVLAFAGFLVLLSDYIDFTHWKYSAYVSCGILGSQLFNIYIYKSMGATDLMTWFSGLGISKSLPSIRFIIDICILFFFLVFLFVLNYLPVVFLLGNIQFLKIGFLVSLSICFVSQLIFSSVMRFTYELSFCLVVLFSILLENVFLDIQFINHDLIRGSYNELWDMLVFIIPLCIGFPIVIGGAGFITSFYSDEKNVKRKQLYRHILMSVFFEFGAVYFIIFPIIEKMILIKDFL